jgi:hypothetical protein
VPSGDPDDDMPVHSDPLRELTERARTVQQLVAACRAYTWAQIHDGGKGLPHEAIAALWGVKRAAVGNALSRDAARRVPGLSKR